MSTPTSSPMSPVRPTERAEILDALRGFALFGILLANMPGFTGFWDSSDQARAALFGAAAAWHVEFGIAWLISGKFYSLFSLLFGIGFAIQLGRLEAHGEPVSRYIRRLLILLCIGLVHILIWPFDIVSLYAVMGLVLLLFRRASGRMLLVTAALLWTVPIAWEWAKVSGFKPDAPFEMAAHATLTSFGIDFRQSPLTIWASPDLLLHLKANAAGFFYRLGQFAHEIRPAKVLAMFLIGLWIGRRSIYLQLDDYAPLMRKVAVAGFAIGLPASALMAWYWMTWVGTDPARNMYAAVTYTLGVPALALAYASTFALLWQTRARRYLAVFAPAGRMALTNYLAQTVIQALLFYGYGLGLVGKVSNTWVPLIGLLIFAFQLFYSRLWLGLFRFGPMEWLWRTLTYGTPQPMVRIRKTAPTSG